MYTNENDINNFKCYNEKGEKIITKSEYIIVDYLSLLNEHFFEKNKYSITYISLPVFMMIKKIKIICEAIDMKDITIIDESLQLLCIMDILKIMIYFYKKIKIMILFKKIFYLLILVIQIYLFFFVKI